MKIGEIIDKIKEIDITKIKITKKRIMTLGLIVLIIFAANYAVSQLAIEKYTIPSTGANVTKNHINQSFSINHENGSLTVDLLENGTKVLNGWIITYNGANMSFKNRYIDKDSDDYYTYI
jgi:hypothetical protein